MTNKYNKLTCLFGHHNYSKNLTRDNRGRYIHLCQICGKSGYRKSRSGRETWRDYDKEGNCIHIKCFDDVEGWFDYTKKGNRIHERWSDGGNHWKDNDGNWVDKKPKNWKYEKRS